MDNDLAGEVKGDVKALKQMITSSFKEERANELVELLDNALEVKDKALPTRKTIALENDVNLHVFFFPRGLQNSGKEPGIEVLGRMSAVLENKATAQFAIEEVVTVGQEDGHTRMSRFNAMTDSDLQEIIAPLQEYMGANVYGQPAGYLNEINEDEGYAVRYFKRDSASFPDLSLGNFLNPEHKSTKFTAFASLKTLNLDEFGEVGRRIESLYKARDDELHDTLYANTIRDLLSTLDRRISGVGIDAKKLILSEKMFIAGGRSNTSMLYRKQAIDVLLNMSLGEKAQQWIDDRELINEGHVDIASPFFESFNNVDATKRIEAIDKGESFIPHILSPLNLSNMSKKEFKRGLRLYGETVLTQHANSGYNHIAIIIGKELTTVQHHLALAKFPEQWNIDFSYDTLASIATKYSGMAIEYGHSLTKTGIELDRAKGAGDKAAMASIKERMKRYSKGDLIDVFTVLHNKFKGETTLRDHGIILADFVDSVVFRMMLDAPFISNDSMSYKDQSLSINNAVFLEEISKHAAQVNVDFDTSVTSDYLQSGGAHPSIFEALRWDTDGSFYNRLEANDKLHKQQPMLVTDTNLHISDNVHFTVLIDDIEPLGSGYTIEQIKDRISLLEEGSAMKHCIFSHMNTCLDNSRVVFSIRDENNERVATMEVEREDDEFYLKEIQGYNNTPVSRSVSFLAETWLYELNQDESLLLDFFKTPPSHDLHAMIGDAPLENGALLNSYPYLGTGAIIAYFAFDEYAAGLTFDSFADEHPEIRFLLDHSGFKNTLDLYINVARQLDIKPLELARLHATTPDVPTSPIELMQMGEHALETGNEILLRRREMSESGLSVSQQNAEMTQWLTGELGYNLTGNLDWLVNGEPDWFTVARTLNLQSLSINNQKEPSIEPQFNDVQIKMTMR